MSGRQWRNADLWRGRKRDRVEPGAGNRGAEDRVALVFPVVDLDRVGLPCLKRYAARPRCGGLLEVVVEVEDDVPVRVADDDARTVVGGGAERIGAAGGDVQGRLVNDAEVVLVGALRRSAHRVAQCQDVEVIDVTGAQQRSRRDRAGLVRVTGEVARVDTVGPLPSQRTVARNPVVAAAAINHVIAAPGRKGIGARRAGIGVVAGHSRGGAAVLGHVALTNLLAFMASNDWWTRT